MRRRRSTYYRRPAAAKPAQDDGCLTGLITVLVTWGVCIVAIGIAIALH
jgi:hypothetical protein